MFGGNWAGRLARVGLCVALLHAWGASASDRVVIAVITDGPLYQLQDVEATFRDELVELVNGEFDLDFRALIADWSADSVNTALEAAYGDPEVQLVLVLGAAANQMAVSRAEFPKPTFLPLVFNPQIVGAPGKDNVSGKKNLNYLADQIPVTADIASFQRVSPFTTAVLVSDAVIIESLPQGPGVVRRAAEDVEFSFLGHDGVDHHLLDRIPSGVEAVLLGGLPRLPAHLFDQFLSDLADRGIRTFSLVSEAEVKRGALASYTTLTDLRRLARRNALNIQAVLLGEKAENQPISYQGKRQLTINLDTAKRIGLSPRFDVLSEAEVIDRAEIAEGPSLTLQSVGLTALQNNLGLAASTLDVDLGREEVRAFRANLLPQLSIAASSTTREDNVVTRTPGMAERSSAGALTLDQLIYAESVASGYRQQQLAQAGREARLSVDRLDQVQSATTAFLQALVADNQLAIQQENLKLSKTNLELAQDRVRIGSASNADVYRWQANLATARSNVLAALAQRDQSREALNQALNQPLDQSLSLEAPTRDSPFVLAADEFDELINNPRRFGWFTDFSVARGLERAPELHELDFQIKALERDIVGKRREFWLPQFSLQAQYLDSMGASGRGSGTAVDTVNDWSVALNLQLPLFAGNARRANLDRARIQKRQLELLRAATAQSIERAIRAALHSAQASYVNIELSQIGARASRQNLELVSEAYRQGTVSIIDLLDAQNQSLQADLNANNAVHNFLLDIMNYQRATNAFDFLLPAEEQQRAKQRLFEYIRSRAAESPTPGADVP